MPYVPVTFAPRNNSNHPVSDGVINMLQNVIQNISAQFINVQPLFQSVPYAATINLVAYAGATVKVGTLTGDVAFGPPTDALPGFTLTLILTQDGTGGHNVTFDAVFTGPKTVSTTASATTVLTFVYDGVSWQ